MYIFGTYVHTIHTVLHTYVCTHIHGNISSYTKQKAMYSGYSYSYTVNRAVHATSILTTNHSKFTQINNCTKVPNGSHLKFSVMKRAIFNQKPTGQLSYRTTIKALGQQTVNMVFMDGLHSI